MDETRLKTLRGRIHGLRAKTLENGCTEAEALLAATKVAELMERYDLSLSDVEIRAAACARRVYEDCRNKRVPIGDCIAAIASFCNCRVWREKSDEKSLRYVFFGLPADIDAAHCLTEVIDHAIRSELGHYKTSAAYKAFRHSDRHRANASFALGMAASIATTLAAMKAGQRSAHGRAILVLKTTVVDTELAKLNLRLRETTSAPRIISPNAYDAGEAAGSGMTITTRSN